MWDGISSTECSDGRNDEKSSRHSTSEPEKHKGRENRSIQFPYIRDKISRSISARVPHIASKNSSSTAGSSPLESAMDKISSSTRGASTPSAKKREPRVVHGPSMSKGVPFRDVCCAIRDTAFASNDLPVIISLEVHASPQQQEVMVEIMQEVWHEFLVDMNSVSTISSGTLPSPHDLRRKILIKVKGSPFDSHAESGQAESGLGSKKSRRPPVRKVIDLLSSLAVYTPGYAFKDFSQPEASLPAHIFSLSEAAIRKLHKSHSSLLFAHNRNFLMRVFPSGMRVNSSNFDPCFFWHQGVQMVVMNWQRMDMGMMLNEGMFVDELGWALKPEGYRSNEPTSTLQGSEDPHFEAGNPTLKRCNLSLTLTILAGQNIQLPSGDAPDQINLYLACDLHLAMPEERSFDSATRRNIVHRDGSYKRRSKPSKGLHPDFKSESLQFPIVLNVAEELSFLR